MWEILLELNLPFSISLWQPVCSLLKKWKQFCKIVVLFTNFSYRISNLHFPPFFPLLFEDVSFNLFFIFSLYSFFTLAWRYVVLWWDELVYFLYMICFLHANISQNFTSGMIRFGHMEKQVCRAMWFHQDHKVKETFTPCLISGNMSCLSCMRSVLLSSVISNWWALDASQNF